MLAPDLDVAALRDVAAAREALGPPGSGRPVGLFFYARPTKPRNLFPVGRAALRILDERWTRHSGDQLPKLRIITGGEPGVQLGLKTIPHTPLGKTNYAMYYKSLVKADVTLSLMMSPHPSHPPLEAAVSGGRAVTNTFRDYRTGLHANLFSAPPDPAALADAIMNQILGVLERPAQAYRPLDPGVLGRPMDDVIRAAADALRAARMTCFSSQRFTS